MITQYTCPICNKRTEVLEETPFLSSKIRRKLKCGHSQIIEKVAVQFEEEKIKQWLENYESLEGEKPFQHQKDCVLFSLLTAQGRICIFDEVGVGKTIETILPISFQKKKMLPAIVVCKSVAKVNWMKHWLNCGETFSQVISNGSERWHEKYPVHIISYELLRRVTDNGAENNQKPILERAKTIVLDESHLIKNDVSGRTKTVKNLCEGKPFVFALSGTQVENTASELFPVFNIVRSDKFHNRDGFLHRYFEMYRDGWTWKPGRLLYPVQFKKDTEDFVIRRKMDDVLPNLPEVRKNNIFVELGDKTQEIYDKEAEKFSEFYNNEKGKMPSFEFYSNILAKLNILRQITGMAKVEAGENFVEEFLEGTERKLVIFTHHHRVAELYQKRLALILEKMKLNGLVLFRAQDANRAEQILDSFKHESKSRVMLASTQASGTSINMQFCSDCLLSERQWTPSKEEQAGVGRFRRPGQKNIINFNYLIGVGTVDEHLTQIIERKVRHIAQIDGAYKGEQVIWEESNVIKELAEILANSGKERWKLS